MRYPILEKRPSEIAELAVLDRDPCFGNRIDFSPDFLGAGR